MSSPRSRISDVRRRAALRTLPSSAEIAWVRRSVRAWFTKCGRKFPWRAVDASVYLQIVTESLLQRTRAETVAAFLPRFMRRFPSWSRLASARQQQLQSCLRPIGLWRRRAKSLVALSRAVVELEGCWPKDREALESLPGVGQYVASAVLLFVHRRPEPLLDANMARVVERVFGARTMADIRHDPWLQALSRRLVSCRAPIVVNWAVLDLAALVCTQRSPRCGECPIARRCRYYAVSVSASGRAAPRQMARL